MMIGQRGTCSSANIQVVKTITASNTASIAINGFAAGDIGVLLCNNAVLLATDWTKIEDGTSKLTLFVKQMSGSETTIELDDSPLHSQVTFFRGALLPTTANSAIAATTNTDPNPPACPVNPTEKDFVYIGGATSVGSILYWDGGGDVTSGYTLLAAQSAAQAGMATGYRTGLTGAQNPGAYPWGCVTSATSEAVTLLLQKA